MVVTSLNPLGFTCFSKVYAVVLVVRSACVHHSSPCAVSPLSRWARPAVVSSHYKKDVGIRCLGWAVVGVGGARVDTTARWSPLPIFFA